MKKIPTVNWYKITKNGQHIVEKRPQYVLHSKKEEKAKQDELRKSNMLGYYYGTDCNKCCGVYPSFQTSVKGFDSQGYYVCLVCGKESKHASMPWIARDYWNGGKYEWEPERQLTIYDLLPETER